MDVLLEVLNSSHMKKKFSVSILIVMDVLLEGTKAHHYVMHSKVSILIVMDVLLEVLMKLSALEIGFQSLL